MEIILSEIGKSFKRNNWILRDINFKFKSGHNYGITGHNGSGKSTLLKIISGYLTPTTGQISFTQNGSKIKLDDLYRSVNIAAPYDGLVDELTLSELFDFHFQFKKWRKGWDKNRAIAFMNFEQHKDKYVSDFSSGMRQRIKLILCLCSDGLLYLLDEPTSNLDIIGKDWYGDLVRLTHTPDRITIIASNEVGDFIDVQDNIEL